MKTNNFLRLNVLLLMMPGLLLVVTGNVFAQTCTPAPVGLVSWYQGEGNALDSRSSNNGTLGVTTFAAGKVGQAFTFNNGSGVSVPDNAALSPQNFTIETWFTAQPQNFAQGTQDIVAKSGGGAAFGYELAITPDTFGPQDGGVIRFLVRGVGGSTGDLIDSGHRVVDGNFHHVAATYDGATMKIFLDGALSAQLTFAATINYDPNSQFVIGFRQAGGFITPNSGLIDELSFYNRALSLTEIQAIFNAGTAGKCQPTATVAPLGLVAWLAGDGNASDISGSGNNGSLQGGAGFAVGKVGQGFSFNASANSGVIIPSTPALNPTDAITLEAWVKPSSFPNPGNAVMRKDVNVGTNQYNLTVLNTGQALCGMGTFAFPVGGSVPLNQWSHLACTYDRQNARLYVNGVEVAAVAATQPIPQASLSLSIGTEEGLTNSNFDGLIDEPTIYNSILTPAEITSIFNAGIAGKLKQTTTAGTTATVGDATVTFAGATTRTTQEIPLAASVLPALPAGLMPTGLFYDVATDQTPSGTTDLCFNLPFVNDATQFVSTRVLHLENGVWQDRTTTANFGTRELCAQVSSLSPFAIASLIPTAAAVTIGGRVVTNDGRGISRARLTLVDQSGETRFAFTNPFGFYRFADVAAGQTYVVTVSHKRYQFTNPTQFVSVAGEISDLNFIAKSSIKIVFLQADNR